MRNLVELVCILAQLLTSCMTFRKLMMSLNINFSVLKSETMTLTLWGLERFKSRVRNKS